MKNVSDGIGSEIKDSTNNYSNKWLSEQDIFIIKFGLLFLAVIFGIKIVGDFIISFISYFLTLVW